MVPFQVFQPAENTHLIDAIPEVADIREILEREWCQKDLFRVFRGIEIVPFLELVGGVSPFADRAFLVGSAQARIWPIAHFKYDTGVALVHVVFDAAALLPFMPVLGSHVHRDVSILL